MERRQRTAEIDANAGDFTRAERTVLADHPRQRLAVDVFHPDAGLVAVAIRAVDGDDV